MLRNLGNIKPKGRDRIGRIQSVLESMMSKGKTIDHRARIRDAQSPIVCGQMASALIMDCLVNGDPAKPVDDSACIAALTARGWGEEIVRANLPKTVEMIRLVLRAD